MKKCLLFTLLLVLYGTAPVFSQDETTPDGHQVLPVPVSESREKLMQLIEAGYDCLTRNPDSALVYAIEAKELSGESGYAPGEIEYLKLMAAIWEGRGNYAKAIELMFKALVLAEENDKAGVADCYLQLSFIYSNIGDERLSLHNAFKALQSHKQFSPEDAATKLACLIDLSDSYEKLNKPDSALYFAYEARRAAVNVPQSEDSIITLINLGNIYVKKQEPALGLTYYRLGLPAALQGGYLVSVNEICMGIAGIYRQWGNNDSARFYAMWACETAVAARRYPAILLAAGMLTEIFREAGKTDSAYKYLSLATGARDTVFNQEQVRMASSLAFTEHLREQEIAAARQEQMQNRKDNLQLTGIAIFIVFLFLMLVILYHIKLSKHLLEFIGWLALLLLFELFSLVSHSYIGSVTHHSPVLMLGMLTAMAIVLVPLHHSSLHWIKRKLGRK